MYRFRYTRFANIRNRSANALTSATFEYPSARADVNMSEGRRVIAVYGEEAGLVAEVSRAARDALGIDVLARDARDASAIETARDRAVSAHVLVGNAPDALVHALGARPPSAPLVLIGGAPGL